MDLRPAAARQPHGRRPRGEAIDRRTTTVDPRTPWSSLVVWFLAAFELGPDVAIGYVGTDTTQPPSAVRISTPDGSWAEVALDPEFTDGAVEARALVEGGPRALWRCVEDAHRRWESYGRPGWERFGMTAAPQSQIVWLDDPRTGPQWVLSASQRGPAAG